MRKILRGHVFNIKFLFTLCLGFAFSATHAQVSGTFTINSAVATGSGNFQTFNDAVAYLAGGVTGPVTFNVQIGSGPYLEQVVLSNITGTSATNTITFNCNGERIRFVTTSASNRAGIKLDNTDYVTFDNLTVETTASTVIQYGIAFQLLNDADNNTIKNCHTIQKAVSGKPDNTEGIVINGSVGRPTTPGSSYCDNNLIMNNVIDGAGVGITLNSAPDGTAPEFINGNKILNNTISNFLTTGIECYYTSGTQIDGNNLVGGTNTGRKPINCILLSDFNQSVSVTNNSIHDLISDVANTGTLIYGIAINSQSEAGKECLIANNLLYNWSADGWMYGIGTTTTSPNYIASFYNVYNNTISFDDQSQLGTRSCGLHFETVADVNVENNIVTISRQAVGNIDDEAYGIHINTSASRFISEHNVFYITTTIPASNRFGIGNYIGSVLTTKAEWSSYTGNDYYTKTDNPLYANLAGGDLKPTAQAIDNMAVYVKLSTDITNATRSTSAPDPGCFEFTSPNCTTPVNGGLAFLNDSSFCQGPKIGLSLMNNSAGNGQTYTWQSATTATGTFSNVSGALATPNYEATPAATLFYRAAVTCGGVTAYSSIVKVLITSPLNSGTYTINNALPTGGINYNSFNDAISGLQCGFNGNIIFNVVSGGSPYNEQVIIPALPTSPTKTITINGNGATITYLPTNTSQRAVIKLNGADYITLDSLNVVVQEGASGFGYGIQLINDADNNTIKRCTVNLSKTSISPDYIGIAISGDNNAYDENFESYCDNNLIAGNTVIGGNAGIVAVSQATQLLLTYSAGNTIKKNTLLDGCSYGIHVAGSDKMLIDSNDISHPTRTAFPASAFYGISLLDENHSLTITRNRVHDLLTKAKTSVNSLGGIYMSRVSTTSAAEGHLIANNEVYNFNGNGVQDGLYILLTNFAKFYHNTVSLEDTAANPALSFGTRAFAEFGITDTGVVVKDNSFVVKRGGTQDKYCMYLGATTSDLVANYNNYYVRSNGGPAYIGSMIGLNYATMTDWLTTLKDANSLNIDPVYNDLAKGDLTPTKIVFENRGSSVGITNDLLNTTRSTTTPDIGAIEFTICSPLSKPKVSIGSAETNKITYTWNSIPNTTGYRVSRDKLNWTIPSTGAMGLSHTVTGLKPTDKITLWVKALGTRIDCPEYVSDSLDAQALTDGIFVPNTFTPNGDPRNEYFKVYSNVTRSIHWMVFNQWGEKLFESNDIEGQWGGIYKGKAQPVGVYVYVVSAVLTDGTKVSKKGTFNLVR